MERLSEEQLQAIAETSTPSSPPKGQETDLAAYQKLNEVLKDPPVSNLSSSFSANIMVQIHQQKKMKLARFEQTILAISVLLGGFTVFWGASLSDWGGLIAFNLLHFEKLIGLSGGSVLSLFVIWFAWENFEMLLKRFNKLKLPP